MKITEFAEYIWSDRQDRYILIRDKSINWTSPVCQLKGASAAQEQLQQSESDFYNTMTQDYNTTFGENQAIMSTLTTALNPIVAAGPNQMGFNSAELNNLNSTALQGTGQTYANASKALKEQQASSGGGNSYLPSGVQSQQQQSLATSAANQESNQLLGIQQAGYQQGYNMYNSAMGGLAGVAGMESPTAYSSAATGAAGAANTEANAVTQANDAWAQNLSGLASGAMGGAGAALGGIFCWIAAEIFGGWKDPRTVVVRKWLREEFIKHWYGRLFNRWYSAKGRKVAKQIQNNRPLRWFFQKLFERFLEQATKSKEGVCQ
jgi:hypothetical protein